MQFIKKRIPFLLNKIHQNKFCNTNCSIFIENLYAKIRKKDIFIGSEYGVARYQKIKDYKFEPAYKYWKETNLYWKGCPE